MAHPQEHALHCPWGDTLPAPGRTLEVAPGVRWLRMGLPFALDHINLWLLRDEVDGVAGWTVVDCGIDDAATRALWEEIFRHELQGLPVLRVVATHMHPDHVGLAHWLCERFSGPARAAAPRARECRLWMSATDWNAARNASAGLAAFGGDSAARFHARHGLRDPAALQFLRDRRDHYARLVPQVPPRYRRLMDGDVLHIGGSAWHCIAGYGHAPEHMALHAPALGEDGVLISGDMVLPRISTNVSVVELEPEADPLALYLRSLAGMQRLPAGTLVLPSHGRPFTGLHTRLAQLQQHHADRLAEVVQACAEAPHSAAELLPLMFRRPLDLHQTTFAMGEAVAHLNFLAGQGRLQAAEGADGVLRFRSTPPAPG